MDWLKREFRTHRRFPSNSHGLRGDIEWAEFALRRQVVYCLLGLLTIETIFALAMAARIARDGVGLTTFVIGGLLTWTVGRTGNLLFITLKSIFR